MAGVSLAVSCLMFPLFMIWITLIEINGNIAALKGPDK